MKKVIYKSRFKESESKIVISCKLNDNRSKQQISLILDNLGLMINPEKGNNEWIFEIFADTNIIQKIRNTDWRSGIFIIE